MQAYRVDKAKVIRRKFVYFKKSKNFIKETKGGNIRINRWPFKFGLKSLENVYLYRTQLEGWRILLRRATSRDLMIRVAIMPTTATTAKSKGARMGRGKGSFKRYVFKLQKGRVIIEFNSFLNLYASYSILSAFVSKMPFKCVLLCITTSKFRSD